MSQSQVPTVAGDDTLASQGRRSEERLAPGTVIEERFRILAPLGAGGMGVVYEALDLSLDRHVALKLRRVERDTAQASRMWREAKAMARLTHPNVLTVHQVGYDQGHMVIAMELVDGGTVRQWLETPRSWREVVDVFLQAARGLAAAHDAGLIHRDFKPDNILLGHDGRVRVADFGLARTADEPLDSSERTIGDEPAAADDARLTRTGSTLGTPGYIAPEQLGSGTVDARADQFSYCVALYEALWGERPFRGETLAERYVAAAEGRIHPPDPSRDVPRWVREIVERGLQPDPADRFADMRALVTALQADPGRARRRRLAGLGVLGALGLTAWITSTLTAAPSPCESVAAAVEDHWSASQREAIAQRLQTVAPRVGPSTFERLRTTLDAYAAAWAEQREQACLATRVHGEQSEALLDLRMACLDRRAAELDALVELLRTADADLVIEADGMLDTLGPLEACADASALRAQVPLPEALEDRDAARAVRAEAARILTMVGGGRARDERERAEALVRRAEALGDGPSQAEARIALAAVLVGLGEHDDARTVLVAAHRDATASGHAHAAYDSALRLASTIGRTRKTADAGLEWLEVAEGWHARMDLPAHERGRLVRTRGDLLVAAERYGEVAQVLDPIAQTASLPRRLRSQLAEVRAIALRRLGRLDEGRQALEEAIALAQAEYGDDHPTLAGLLVELANAQYDHGEFPQALQSYQRAQQIRIAAYGERAPSVAELFGSMANVRHAMGDEARSVADFERAIEMLHGGGPQAQRIEAVVQANFANALNGMGRGARAVQAGERALALAEEIYGRDSVKVAQMRINLGNAYGNEDRHEDAVAQYTAALPILEKTLDSDHPSIGALLLNLAISLVELQRWDEAEEAIARADRLFQARNDPGSAWPARVWTARARFASGRGDQDAAVEGRRHAADRYRQLDPAHPELAEAAFRLGVALLDAERAGEAAEPLEEARRLVEARGGDDRRRARILFRLAEARWTDATTRDDARTLAQRAQALLPAEDAELHAEITAWRAAHDPG